MEDKAHTQIATGNLATLENDFGVGPCLLRDMLSIADAALMGLPLKALDAFARLNMAADTAKTEKVVKHSPPTSCPTLATGCFPPRRWWEHRCRVN